ncbi:2-hydroxycarboxylate transporter family protein [Endozoicomonas gorgoniicola]|uniref:2-hydroxycarboxylate transporter family protein n=1 Tax=Endozoicomonas gorgoniicola TaxID=1234144 RepID=A0ABT3MZ98_9GAMM|nr:2-hydroxycarboxylate transporter family protein [Endozoicomonas gorgoniicola]MCW7554694.1 2-hydroxycarboxylate transporter family protein [Endozoicomonas gorgoniicola]
MSTQTNQHFNAASRESLPDKLMNLEVFGMSIHLFAAAATVILVAHAFDVLPGGLVGGLSISFVIGAVFGEIGKRLPFWNRYIGGAPVLIFLGTAWLVYAGLMSEREVAVITDFIKNYKFIDLFIAVLITGSILSVNRVLLRRSLVGYIPSILFAVAGAAALGIACGMMFGISPGETIMLYVLPIMGGGNGAGAVPLAEIYQQATGNSAEAYYSVAISILTIANIIAIAAASILDRLGKKYSNLTGDGELVRKGKFKIPEDDKPGRKITPRDLAVGLLLACTAYTLGHILSKIVPSFAGVSIHRYAYMVIVVAVMNMSGIVPVELKIGAQKMSQFFSKQMLWVLMVGVGVAYTDLGEIIAAISLTNIIMATMIVLGAVIGGALGGRVAGFYEIETAITAGLCMANRGGSGDLEVMAASKRMHLISYAQISSRLGGGIVLVIASVAFGILA